MKSHKKKELELLLGDWSFELPKGEKGDKGDKGEKGDDGLDYILTEQDKKEIAEQIEVPVVEKVIEKTQIIKKIPIVTNEIKEVAVSDTPEEIRNKLELLLDEDRLDATYVKNIEKNIDIEKVDVSKLNLNASQIVGLQALIPQQNTGGSLYRLRSMLDVDVSAATSGSLLTYNGSVWVPVAPATPGKRVTSITSSAYPEVNTDECDAVDITALATNILSMSDNLTGTPTNKQTLVYEIKDNGGTRSIVWGASFVEGGVILPTMTVAGKILTVGFMYSTANGLNKWRCIASAQEA